MLNSTLKKEPMRDLGVMSLKAAEQYMFFFQEHDIACEIKDFLPVLYFLIGGGLGHNRRVNLLVRHEDYARAKVLFDEQETKHTQKVAELVPAANRVMAIIGVISVLAVFVFYWFVYVRK